MTHLKALLNARSVWKVGCALLVLVQCVGCQPSLDERLVSAKRFMIAGDYRASIIDLKNILRETPTDAEVRSLIAQSFYQMADFPAAAGEFERSLVLGRDTTENWIGLGEALLRAGVATEALERVVPNLDPGSTNSRELALIANVYASLGNKERAIALYEKLLDIDAESEQGLIGLALIASSNGDGSLAEEFLSRAANSDQATSRVFTMQGYHRRMRRDLTGAIGAFEMAIAREGIHTNLADRFDARAALATSLIDKGEIQRLQPTLDDLNRYFPGHPIHNFLRGRVAFAEGNLELASIELREYLARAPDDLRANVVIGAVSFYQSYYSQADMYLRQAVRENVGGENAIRLLAKTRLQLNKPEEALELLYGAGVTDGDVLVLGLLGRAEFRSGNRNAGLEYMEKGVSADPDSMDIRLMYATALIADGQNGKAIEVLEAMPEFIDASHRKEILILSALERQGNRENANKLAISFLESNSEDSAAHALVGSFMQSSGNTEQAFSHYQEALQIDKANQMALFGLASLASDSGMVEEAEQFLDRLLEVEPSHMPALVMLADILSADQRFGLLTKRIETAVSAAPMLPGPRLLKARTALSSGDPNASLAIVREARELFPDAVAFIHLEGIVLIAMEQTESALISLARAAAAEPDNAGFQFDLSVASLQVQDFFVAGESIELYRKIIPQDPIGLSVQVSSLIGQREYAAARDAVKSFEFDDESVAIGNVLTGDIDLAEGLAIDAVSQYEIAAKSTWSRGIAIRLSSAYLAAGSDKAPKPLVRWLLENPDDAAVRRSYGELLQFSGSNVDATIAYEAVVAANANDAIALNNLAWEYSKSGRLEALDLAKRAYELEPEQASILDTYAWILYLNNDADNALRLLRKAVMLAPENGYIGYHLAKVLVELGEREEAVKMIEKLLISNKDFAARADVLALSESLQ